MISEISDINIALKKCSTINQNLEIFHHVQQQNNRYIFKQRIIRNLMKQFMPENEIYHAFGSLFIRYLLLVQKRVL